MLAKHPQLATRVPVLLGGHDHDLFVESCGGSADCVVVKVGQDAEKIGVVDIWWDGEGKVHSSIAILEATAFELSPEVSAFRDQQDAKVTQRMEAPIAFFPEPMSSKRVRFEPSDVATFLLSIIKRGLARLGVEVALIQGGAVRAGKDYPPGPFCMADLYAELAFDCHQAVIQLPGHIIAESIHNTRNLPKPAPNFLHADSGVIVAEDGSHRVLSIAGSPFEPQRVYTVAIYRLLLTGLNAIEPLCSYVKEHTQIPKQEACAPAKSVVIEVLARDAWRRVLGLASSDEQDASEAVLDQCFKEMDKDGDQFITRLELETMMEERFGENPSGALIACMMNTLDLNHDGIISKEEFFNLGKLPAIHVDSKEQEEEDDAAGPPRPFKIPKTS